MTQSWVKLEYELSDKGSSLTEASKVDVDHNSDDNNKEQDKELDE